MGANRAAAERAIGARFGSVPLNTPGLLDVRIPMPRGQFDSVGIPSIADSVAREGHQRKPAAVA
jgi:hypothetical protein